MKQMKTTKSKTVDQNRNYFNPYASSTSSTPSSVRQKSKSPYGYPKRGEQIRGEERLKKSSHSTRKKRSTTQKKRNMTTSDKRIGSTTNKQMRSQGTRSYSQSDVYIAATQMTPEQRRMQMRKKTKLTKSQRMKMRRKRQIQSIIRIIVAMCVTVGVVWGGLELKEGLKKPSISHQQVKLGTLNMSTMYDGIIFRNEKIILSEEEGYAKYIVAEGEKVEKNGNVYVLVDEANLATSTSAKQEVESQIYNKADKKKQLSTNQDLRYSIDQGLKNDMQTFYNNRYDSSTNPVYTLRSKLDSSIASRTTIYTAEQVVSNQDVVALKKEIEDHIANYQKGKASLQSGIISYRMDGCETENALSVIETMDYASYEKYQKIDSATRLSPSKLQKEAPIYKLVYSNEWYVVTYVDSSQDQLNEGQLYDLNFEEITGKNVKCRLISKKEEDKKVQLVFRSSEQMDQLLGNRKVNFSIGEKELSGLKIPTEAITELNMLKLPEKFLKNENGVTGAYRQKDTAVEFVEIQDYEKSGETYLVSQEMTSGLKINDILVETESGETYKITESEVRKGVYVINSQIAKFTPIEILAQNGEYTLVKYNNSSKLKEMDKIISNPMSIKNGQLLEDMKIENE